MTVEKRQRGRKIDVSANSHNDGLPWIWQDVELSTGVVIKVRGMPAFLAEAAMVEFPLPKPPLISVTSQLPGGGTTVREDLENAEYNQQLAEVIDKRQELLNDFQLHWGVDLEVPEDPAWREELTKFLPSIAWSKYGLKVDYLKFVVLTAMTDLVKVRRVISNLGIPTTEEVDSVVESFRDQT